MKSILLLAFPFALFLQVVGQTTFPFSKSHSENIGKTPTIYAFNSMWNQRLIPTINSSGIRFSNFTGTSVTIYWTNGNGTRRLLLARQDTGNIAFPIDGSEYSANAVFGSGDLLGGNSYVIYNGAGNEIRVTGLIPGKIYYFRAIEYNKNPVTGNSTKYLLWNNPVATPPVTYIFTGNGNWDNPANWNNSMIPPPVLPDGSEIDILPQEGGECILNVAQTISTGASLNIQSTKKFRILGNLILN